jgi:methylase of polypeptide subunit release factors
MDVQELALDNFQTRLPALDHQGLAILSIGKDLKAAGYRFVTPTPLTCGRVLARPRSRSNDRLVDAFGWNRPFAPEELDAPYRQSLAAGGLLAGVGSQVRSLVRFSTLSGMLFAHSGYPTANSDAVFFGPDTYRFTRALRWLADHDPTFQPQTVIDVGTGSGVGGIYATSVFRNRPRIILSDINPRALAFAQTNATLNGIEVETCLSDVLSGVQPQGDLIISNPPYLVDARSRTYRHGGGHWGCALGVRILGEALDKLTPGGQLLLYTGSPIVNGCDRFLEAAEHTLAKRVRRYHYEEQDPDVFGEELDHAPYDNADRIATVVLHVTAANMIR